MYEMLLKKSFEDKNMGRGIVDVVASLFDVEKKYEKAMEVALGKKMQNIVCEDEHDAKRIINYLKENKLRTGYIFTSFNCKR